MLANAASLSGSARNETAMSVRPSCVSPADADATPDVDFARLVACDATDVGANTVVWLVNPAENDRSMTFCALTLAGVPSSCAVCDSPTEYPDSPRLRIASPTTAATDTITGRRATRRANPAQKPRVSASVRLSDPAPSSAAPA